MTATGSAMLRPEDLEPAARRTMRALRTHQRGGPERLVYEDAPIPHVGVGDALVRVHAAAITPAELTWEGTWVDRAGRDRRPTIPAHEVSGVVAALGNGTTGISVGQAVYGLTDWYRDGAAAEYVAVEARNLAPKPASLGHVEAAAVPLPGLTAWQALFVHGRLAADQTVLVHGAGGGVHRRSASNRSGAAPWGSRRVLRRGAQPAWTRRARPPHRRRSAAGGGRRDVPPRGGPQGLRGQAGRRRARQGGAAGGR